jgi:hypothetical protein
VGEARGIGDRDVQVFPANPVRPVAAPIAGDPVAQTFDPPELLAAEVEQLARGSLVADRWRGDLKGA